MPDGLSTLEYNSDTDNDEHMRKVDKTLDPLRAQDLEAVLKLIQNKNWTLGAFLQDLFTTPKVQQKDGNPQTQTQMVSIFLQGRSKVKAQDIVEMMYASRYSTPKAVRQSAHRSASEAKRRDKETMARWGLEQWAIEKVEKLVDEEAEMVSSKEGELHLANEDATWDFIVNFSLSKVLSVVETKGPTILRLLLAAALPKGKRPIPRIPLTEQGSESGEPGQASDERPSYVPQFEMPPPAGSGKSRWDPLIVCILLNLLSNYQEAQ